MDALAENTRLDQTEFLTGLQAIVRGIIEQGRADRRQGFKTAGFVSGYRGSPLGTLDLELWNSEALLKEYSIKFQPGLNEDLAATACWGTQQVPLLPNPRFDGVFAFWYGKGPGVDRSGDALKHGNLAGTSPKGGVVVLMGDDHGAKSSSTAHQSEHALVANGIPVFNPSSIAEYVEYIPVAIAMSRFASVWVGFKCVTEAVESSSTLTLGKIPPEIILPTDVAAPPGGYHIKLGFMPLVQEETLQVYRIPAVKLFAKANRLDKVMWDAPTRSLGIIAPGKAYVDTMEAMRLLGIDQRAASAMGIRVFKPLMTWPIEPTGIAEFSRAHREVFVIEEKRPLVEWQLAQILLNMQGASRPALSGKATSEGAPLLPDYGELSPPIVAQAIGKRLVALGLATDEIKARLADLEGHTAEVKGRAVAPVARAPMFCSGCPHNRSTRMPDGSIAFGGIGCHGMAMWIPELHTMSSTHMGAEGANWIGIEPFGGPEHIFQNIGDGTYAHSGLLALRAAIAANSNITYKILCNAAVAMTGGQPVEGTPDALAIAKQSLAEGAKKVALVTEDLSRYPDMPAGIGLYYRDQLDAVQREMREIKGVTVIVYDQGCAAERRRLRKQGLWPDLPIRTFINSDVCEGCGDCNQKSSCVSVLPVETELGTKRMIDQESCNKDYTCVKGFCPSFVTVKGGGLRKNSVEDDLLKKLADALVEPTRSAKVGDAYNIIIAGIGGTGVITLGNTLARAATHEGRNVLTFDVTGVAQKNGAVFSHVRFLGGDNTESFRPRIPREQLDVLIGCDAIASSSNEIVQLLAADRTHAVINGNVIPTATFQRHPDDDMSLKRFGAPIERVLSSSHIDYVSPADGARSKLGSGALLNIFMLGFAYQRGVIPLERQSLEKTMGGGGGGKKNLMAFNLGRLTAQDPARVETLLGKTETVTPLTALPLDAVIARCKTLLTSYQSARYADEYEAFVRNVQRSDSRGGFTHAVARNLFKLMRYKDEYEVARLYTAPEFKKRLEAEFQGDYKLHFNLAPPGLRMFKSENGEPRKFEIGPWMYPLFGLLAKFKGLRGTPFDLLGLSKDRRLERRLIVEYKSWILAILPKLNEANYATAVKIAELPAEMKGYGPVKDRNTEAALTRQKVLIKEFENAQVVAQAAE